jgi:hypothetical protein
MHHFEDSPKNAYIFGNYNFWGKPCSFRYLVQLSINGKVVHYWSLQDVKYQLSPYH